MSDDEWNKFKTQEEKTRIRNKLAEEQLNHFMSPQELNLLHKAQTTYVVLLKHQGKLTLLVDPGLNRPWSSPNKKFADFQATACDGMAETVENAWALLLKENPLFEKQLVEGLSNQQINRNVLTPENDSRNIFGPDGQPII
jgi:hypothetical protein